MYGFTKAEAAEGTLIASVAEGEDAAVGAGRPVAPPGVGGDANLNDESTTLEHPSQEEDHYRRSGSPVRHFWRAGFGVITQPPNVELLPFRDVRVRQPEHSAPGYMHTALRDPSYFVIQVQGGGGGSCSQKPEMVQAHVGESEVGELA